MLLTIIAVIELDTVTDNGCYRSLVLSVVLCMFCARIVLFIVCVVFSVLLSCVAVLS